MIISDEDYAVMKKNCSNNKRLIKAAGFKVCVVKRKYRLFDPQGNMLAERSTFFSDIDTFEEFAKLVKKAVNA